jgi:hypothetical protein
MEVQARIESSARRLRLGVIIATVVFTAIYLVGRLGISFSGVHVDYRSHGIQGASPEFAADATVVLLLIALVRLVQMLSRIGRGEMFTSGVVRRFRGFAFWLLLMALCSLLAPIIIQALTRTGGVHRLVIGLELNDLLMVAITLLLFLLARLLEQARRLDEEMREIV